jgi:glutathione S-transferase
MRARLPEAARASILAAIMKYVIYGAPGSGSGIVEAACGELGVEYEVRDLDARNGEHLGEAYGKINPHHKMPAVVTGDGEVLTESLAIVITLDERHPAGNLLPAAGSAARAKALRWMTFLATELYPLVEFDDYPERFAEAGDAAQTLRARAKQLMQQRWQLVEAQVDGSPYALGTDFCAVDLYITKLAVWLDADWRREHLPKIDAITTATRARPALAKVWARHIRD